MPACSAPRWTPCIGPTLATVLGLAASSSGATAGRGAALSVVYCIGLGTPFLLTGVAFSRAFTALARLRRHTPAIVIAGGALLVVVGALEVTGLWSQLVDHLHRSVQTASPAL